MHGCPRGTARARATQRQRGDDGLARLERELVRLSTIAGGKVAVGVIHLERGRELYLTADEPYPMASTYKVPIAVQLLTRVDSGKVRLDSMIALKPSDLHPGSGTLTSLFDDPGVSLSVRNLLELMLLISDNSATDIVLRTAGGGAAVKLPPCLVRRRRNFSRSTDRGAHCRRCRCQGPSA